jgi:hypothetical protein
LTLRIKADANAGCKEDDTDEEPEPAAGGNLVFGDPAGDNQTVRLLRAQSDGKIRVHDPTGNEENIQAIGPLFDFDSDGSREAPLLKNQNKIVWTDSSDQINLNNKANTDGALLGAGSFGEFSNALYYAESINGQSNGDIYSVSDVDNVNNHKEIQLIENNSITAKAIAGIADIDDDSSNELVFVDANNRSHEVCYISEDESGDWSASTTNITVGSSNSVGRPITLNGDTVIPIVTGGGGISLIEYEENRFRSKSVTEGGAAQAPLTAVDIDGDNELEIVYVSTDSNLKFVDNPSGDDPQVVDVEYDGEEVSASSNVGIL